jgi:hypothetical protein
MARLQKEYKLARTARESIERDLMGVREEIREAISFFLRDALKADTLNVLARESNISVGIQEVFRELEQKALGTWTPYCKTQASSLREIEHEVAKLSRLYGESADAAALLS